MLAHQRLRGIAVFRTIFSSTVVTSVAVASLISLTLLNPQIGLLNYWLGRTGSLSPLDDPKWALVAVAGVTIWQNLGLSFIIMSAGLQAVPDELLEAARVDGAGAWSRFRNVTLPMLSPTLFFATIVGSILAFHSFGQIDLLTAGRPAGPHERARVRDLPDRVPGEQRRQGRGARDRAVRDHAGAHAACSSASSNGG